MNKKLIRLTESDLHNIVKKSVSNILAEIGNTSKGRNNIRVAINNKLSKAKSENDKDLRNKYYDQIKNVSDYFRKGKKDPYLKDFNYSDIGNKSIDKYYDSQKFVNYEDIAYDLFGEELGENVIEWCESVDFNPTLYFESRGGYDEYTGEWWDADVNVNTVDALEYELDKLYKCPFLSNEQIEEFRNAISNEIDEAEIDNNPLFEPQY